MDFGSIKISPVKKDTAIEPGKIFNSLTLRGSIENIWDTQAWALKEWHKYRNEDDVIVEMATGGGKTLVGLLIAKSIINELNKNVIYMCPTKQLVEQVSKKADECGLAVSLYMDSEWINKDGYDKSETICITNYAAIFNSKSKFRRHDIGAYIFDDAHVCESALRNHYTIRLRPGEKVTLEVAELFRDYFVGAYQGEDFDSAIQGDYNSSLFVPMFLMKERYEQIVAILKKHKEVSEGSDNQFGWIYLGNNIAKCVMLISGGFIEITPPALPLHTLKPFSSDVRRIYLTATLPTKTEFIRTFGINKPYVITPEGKSGQAQRLFVFVEGDSDEEQVKRAKEIVDSRKACIIVPSYKTAERWLSCGRIFQRRSTDADVESFKRSKKPEKIIFAARYDGIDLPGESCRVLILDRVPFGSSLIDRFFDEGLKITAIRASKVAIRIVQAIGRIFRSNTDHGVVILCSQDLQSWFLNPRNHAFLPEILQKQIKFSIKLKENVDSGSINYAELINEMLLGTKGWDTFYGENIDIFEESDVEPMPEWLESTLHKENIGFKLIWDGKFESALKIFDELIEDTKSSERRLCSWYRHWRGFILQELGDSHEAFYSYNKAATIRTELGTPREDHLIHADIENVVPTGQARRILAVYSEDISRILSRIDDCIASLKYGGETKKAEEAVSELGKLLGLDSTRPDKVEGTGPDALWVNIDTKSAAIMELKTDKKTTSQYKKNKDIAQMHDHFMYCKNKYIDFSFYKIIIGHKLTVSIDSNPMTDLRIINLDQIILLALRAKEFYNRLNRSKLKGAKDKEIQAWLEFYGLQWPNCIDNLKFYWAIDLKDRGIDGVSIVH